MVYTLEISAKKIDRWFSSIENAMKFADSQLGLPGYYGHAVIKDARGNNLKRRWFHHWSECSKAFLTYADLQPGDIRDDMTNSYWSAWEDYTERGVA